MILKAGLCIRHVNISETDSTVVQVIFCTRRMTFCTRQSFRAMPEWSKLSNKIANAIHCLKLRKSFSLHKILLLTTFSGFNIIDRKIQILEFSGSWKNWGVWSITYRSISKQSFLILFIAFRCRRQKDRKTWQRTFMVLL